MRLRRRGSSLLNPSAPNSYPDAFRPPSSIDRPPSSQRQPSGRFHQPSSLCLAALTTPPGYELSLSAMYTHNVLANRSRTPSLSNSLETASSSSPPTVYGEMPRHPPTTAPDAQLPSLSKHQMPRLAHQPVSLPPVFVTGFVRNCFSTNLCDVDFTQALKALDYLKVLDDRRKRELGAALRRLHIDTATFDGERPYLIEHYPDLYNWIASMEDKSRRAEALYTQVYIGLRRWTLINEMRLEPFSRHNCTAMLDTLYPTSYSSPPTPQLTDTILNSQRSAFYRYIVAVERNGRSVLHTLENQSRRNGEDNGWPVVREIVDRYLRQSNAVIDECLSISGPASFPRVAPRASPRTNSGASGLSTSPPPTTTTTTTTTNTSSSSPRRPPQIISRAPSPDKPLPAHPCAAAAAPRKSSTFGRLTHRLRRIKSSTHAQDASSSSSSSLSAPTQPSEPRRSLNLLPESAMRSTGGQRSASTGTGRESAPKNGERSRAPSAESGLGIGVERRDLEEQRERLIREARHEREVKEVKARVTQAKQFQAEGERRVSRKAEMGTVAGPGAPEWGSPTVSPREERPDPTAGGWPVDVKDHRNHPSYAAGMRAEYENAPEVVQGGRGPVEEMPDYYADEREMGAAAAGGEERVNFEMPNYYEEEERERAFGWGNWSSGRGGKGAEMDTERVFEMDAGWNPYSPGDEELVVAELAA